MAKLIFQVGLLAFFTSAVVFGLQDYALFDVILRAFIVCVGVILISTVMVFVFAWAGDKPIAPPIDSSEQDGHHTAEGLDSAALHAAAQESSKAKS
jgi:hypothetical protein